MIPVPRHKDTSVDQSEDRQESLVSTHQYKLISKWLWEKDVVFRFTITIDNHNAGQAPMLAPILLQRYMPYLHLLSKTRASPNQTKNNPPQIDRIKYPFANP